MANDEMFTFYKNALQGTLTKPLCNEYRNEWRSCGDDKERLVRLVMRQQSIPYFMAHCHDGKGLGKEYLMRTFREYINGKMEISDADGVDGYAYGLYVGYKGCFVAREDVLALMWCDDTTVRIDTAKCPVLYIGCDSDVRIVCEGYNSPRIYVFDESKVTFDDMDESCNAVVYKYSDGCEVKKGKYCIGKDNIRTFKKELRL